MPVGVPDATQRAVRVRVRERRGQGGAPEAGRSRREAGTHENMRAGPAGGTAGALSDAAGGDAKDGVLGLPGGCLRANEARWGMMAPFGAQADTGRTDQASGGPTRIGAVRRSPREAVRRC